MHCRASICDVNAADMFCSSFCRTDWILNIISAVSDMYDIPDTLSSTDDWMENDQTNGDPNESYLDQRIHWILTDTSGYQTVF